MAFPYVGKDGRVSIDGVTMALNHFATCPQGAAWSKKAGAE